MQHVHIEGTLVWHTKFVTYKQNHTNVCAVTTCNSLSLIMTLLYNILPCKVLYGVHKLVLDNMIKVSSTYIPVKSYGLIEWHAESWWYYELQ